MGVFQWGRPVSNYTFFGKSEPMFTWSVRVGCSFPACRGESNIEETCLIFLRPLLTLVSDPKFIHLATGLSVTLPGLSVNQTGLSLTSIRLVTNMDFQTVCEDKQIVREVLQSSR